MTKEQWNEIILNKDSSVNLEQIHKELQDFSMLIDHITKLYVYISGSMVSYPNTKPEVVIKLFENRLQESYDQGFDDGIESIKEKTK